MNAEFIKYLKGWSEREAAMATADDMELWCTTQGLGIECDDVEVKDDCLEGAQGFTYNRYGSHRSEQADGLGCESSAHTCETRGYNFRPQERGISSAPQASNEFPANTPVQEEGVVVLPAGSHSHSLKRKATA